jgi:hypothetical protein
MACHHIFHLLCHTALCSSNNSCLTTCASSTAALDRCLMHWLIHSPWLCCLIKTGHLNTPTPLINTDLLYHHDHRNPCRHVHHLPLHVHPC